MKTIHRLVLNLLILTSIATLVGCSTAGKSPLPQGGRGDLSMAQIYQRVTGLTTNQQGQSVDDALVAARQSVLVAPEHTSYRGYTQSALNQTRQLFQQLPNPVINLYVYPHLVSNASGSQPVPGYTTAFYFYRQNHFAMPSEAY